MRRRSRGRAKRIRIHEPRSILVIHEPRKPLVLFPIREIGYKAIFLVPCLCDGEQLVQGNQRFNVLGVDVGHKSCDIFKLDNVSGKNLLCNGKVRVRLAAKGFSCALKVRDDFVYFRAFNFFKGEINGDK